MQTSRPCFETKQNNESSCEKQRTRAKERQLGAHKLTIDLQEKQLKCNADKIEKLGKEIGGLKKTQRNDLRTCYCTLGARNSIEWNK